MSQVQGVTEKQEEKIRGTRWKENNLIEYELVVMFSFVNKFSGSTDSSSWTVESGASFYATQIGDSSLYISWGYFGVVKMGNHEKCKVVGIRDVSAVTNMSHILILRNVRHVHI